MTEEYLMQQCDFYQAESEKCTLDIKVAILQVIKIDRPLQKQRDTNNSYLRVCLGRNICTFQCSELLISILTRGNNNQASLVY